MLKVPRVEQITVSSMFRQVASSSDFVERWGSELTCTSTGEQSSRKRAVSSSPSASTTFEDCGPPSSKKDAAMQVKGSMNGLRIAEKVIIFYDNYSLWPNNTNCCTLDHASPTPEALQLLHVLYVCIAQLVL